jgi:16S rRNA G966 N2-methylase RsmD
VTNEALPADDGRLGHLYSTPMPSRRSGPVYNAFSYPTKIEPEAIALFVAAHTAPGDTVLDVFAGSGTTGIAARLCENPTSAMRRRAEELGLPVEWGPRHAVLYELGVIGSLLSRTMCDPPNPEAFQAAAARVVRDAAEQYSWMYDAGAADGRAGALRHAIWSDVLACAHCGQQVTYWELAVRRDPLELIKVAECPACQTAMNTSEAHRVTEVVRDSLTGEDSIQRRRVLAHVYGRSGRATWHRPPSSCDLELIGRVREQAIPGGVPSSEIRWGDLHRSGYHQGIDRFHHFYTRRNLIALGGLWAAIDREPEELRDALRLLVLSYNATHSTLMTRVVVKNGMTDFVLTGAQSGVLYVSSLPVEKNVIEGVRRKIETFRSAFMTSYGGTGTVRVVNASSTQLDLPDGSIDYVFTDPPFGGFIPYAEINQINEAWLGATTDDTEEAIVSPAQGKGVTEYAALMKRVFAEVARVMKDDAAATIVFHSSKPDVWAALGGAFTSAGLVVERTNVLDKTQVSFKQVVSEGSTRGDAIFLLSHGAETGPGDAGGDLAGEIVDLRSQHGQDLSPQHLYSRYVARCVEEGRSVELNAPDFYARLKRLDEVASP